MGFFRQQPDINQGVQAYGATPGAVLLDVRTPQEYRQGHIPGSENIPLQALEEAGRYPKDTPIFVYCHSGSRSRQAAAMLGAMGYTQVKNIGGIAAYVGKVVR